MSSSFSVSLVFRSTVSPDHDDDDDDEDDLKVYYNLSQSVIKFQNVIAPYFYHEYIDLSVS